MAAPRTTGELGQDWVMRVADAQELAAAAQIDPTLYSFESKKHEALCLLANGQSWHVFLSERGQRYDEQVFSNADDACVSFLKRLFQLSR
jgi:hypothetical protein